MLFAQPKRARPRQFTASRAANDRPASTVYCVSRVQSPSGLYRLAAPLAGRVSRQRKTNAPQAGRLNKCSARTRLVCLVTSEPGRVGPVGAKLRLAPSPSYPRERVEVSGGARVALSLPTAQLRARPSPCPLPRVRGRGEERAFGPTGATRPGSESRGVNRGGRTTTHTAAQMPEKFMSKKHKPYSQMTKAELAEATKK
jgi:hypothetical protein